jgi:hypothetical protein
MRAFEAFMNISPFLSVNRPCDQAFEWVQKQLSDAGLRIVQTFDLHDARTGLHDCACPNHGSDDCDCQMVVALVYGKSPQPATLILHGSAGQTWLSLGSPFTSPDESMLSTIEQALESKKSVS